MKHFTVRIDIKSYISEQFYEIKKGLIFPQTRVHFPGMIKFLTVILLTIIRRR